MKHTKGREQLASHGIEIIKRMTDDLRHGRLLFVRHLAQSIIHYEPPVFFDEKDETAVTLIEPQGYIEWDEITGIDNYEFNFKHLSKNGHQ